MSTADDDDEEESKEGSGISLDLVKSYLAFGWRAVRKRKWLAIGLFTSIATLTFVALAYWPRSYHCDTVLMVQSNQVFQDSKQDALAGAAQVITRHSNLVALVKETQLVKDWDKGRTAPYLLKDRIMSKFRGQLSDRDRERVLVGTLQYALGVNAGNGTLTISIDWSHPEVAARIVEAAQQSFLESRHSAEVSTLAEYISILEGHAAKVHDEIDSFAAQIQKMREERLSAVESGLTPAPQEQPAAPRRVARPAPRPLPTSDTGESAQQDKALLEARERELQEMQEQRKRRLGDLQVKLIDLKTRFTVAHPEVLALEQNIADYSKVTAPEEALKSEIDALKARMRMLSSLPSQPGTPGGVGSAPLDDAPGAAPISAEIMRLMQDPDDDLDPALATQLRFAVEKYAMLRGKINSGRVDLDTAQAAFRHRYQVVVPAEPPAHPDKPKVPMVIGGGLAAALLLALAVCLLLELRSGLLVERWQVHMIGLPILAELRLPPSSSD